MKDNDPLPAASVSAARYRATPKLKFADGDRPEPGCGIVVIAGE